MTFFNSNSAKVGMDLLDSLSLMCGIPPGVTEVGGFHLLVSSLTDLVPHDSWVPCPLRIQAQLPWLRLLNYHLVFLAQTHCYRCQMAFKNQEQFPVQLMVVVGLRPLYFPTCCWSEQPEGPPSSQEKETSAPPLNGGEEGKVTLHNIWDGRTLLWQTLWNNVCQNS